MKNNKMRWLCGWLVICLVFGMVFVGFAENVEIDKTEEIVVDDDLQLDMDDIVEHNQDDSIGKDSDLLLDIDGSIDLEELIDDQEIDINVEEIDDGIATSEDIESNANYTAYSNDTIFNIRGKNIKASDVANKNNCWQYANAIYNKIWGVSFSSDFSGSASAGWNMLRNLSDNDRKLTADNLKSFIGASELGASLRITSCTSSCGQWGNDGLSCGHKGHSLIIVGKDSGGVIVVDNHRADGVNYSVNTRYYTWQGFVNYWGSYTYIKYIKWPNAPVYGGSQPVVTASTLQFTNVTYPKTFRINTSAGWALSGGTVESNYDLKSLKTQILNSSGTVISSGSVSISGKSYAIINLDTYSSNDNGVKFSYIKSAGNYKWVLTATDSNGRSLTLEMPFTAVSSGSTVTSTVSKKYIDEVYLDVNGWIDGKEYGNLGDIGSFDVYINGNNVANDVNDYYTKWPVGTSYEIKDIRAKGNYSYTGVHSGSLSGKVGTSTTNIYLQFDEIKKEELDINGWIDGKSSPDLGGKGTVDVYINGQLNANDVNDYCTKWPVGTSYEIKDIKAIDGYSYTGVHSGSLSGKVGSSTTKVFLQFDEIKKEELDINGWIDGKSTPDLGGKGTVDVYINGQLNANDVNDYCTKWPVGTSYEIKDIKAIDGYSYTGVHSGSLSGKIGSETTSVILSFDDTSAPNISNVEIFDITSDGYTISCSISDNVGVTKVKLLVCTGDQAWEDGIWHSGEISGNTASCRIRVSDHDNITDTYYYTRISAWDAAGNLTEYEGALCIYISSTPEPTPEPKEPTSISITKGKSATLYVGETLTLKTKLKPVDAETTLTWTTSNKKVATVSDAGVVKACAKGTAIIRVTTANGKTATCKITVPKAPTKVKFKKSTYTVKKGKTIKLVPVLTPSGAKTTYKWSSSNKKIATVSSKGVVKGIAKGTAKITVKTANGKTATVKIKVK